MNHGQNATILRTAGSSNTPIRDSNQSTSMAEPAPPVAADNEPPPGDNEEDQEPRADEEPDALGEDDEEEEEQNQDDDNAGVAAAGDAAGQQNRAPEAEIIQPRPAFVRPDTAHLLIEDICAYTAKDDGLGISVGSLEPRVPVLRDQHYNMTRFNEPNNKYALKILGRVYAEMREEKRRKAARAAAGRGNPRDNRVSEKIPFHRVIRAEIEGLANALNLMAPQRNFNQQMKDLYWHTFKGFNSNTAVNQVLNRALYKFIMIRMGETPFGPMTYQNHNGAQVNRNIDWDDDCHVYLNGDEVHAAIAAWHQMYVETLPNNATQDYSTRGDTWVMPLVFLLNEHMRLRNITPLCMSNVRTTNDRARTARLRHTRMIWVDEIARGVESRNNVRAEFEAFLRTYYNEDLPDVIEDDQPPRGEPDAPPIRRRRVGA